ncbi:MAG: phosphoribosylglycinamide formyltransferase [Candidatus Omnitrophica bacterium]|nr:phosphoribosylglycinamide formyltransferase [Candidatus Omnitrophota bacterium]
MNIAILASGNGSNFEAIAKAIRRGQIRAEVKLLITDKPQAFARFRAKKLKIKDIFINPDNYPSRLLFDKKLVEVLKIDKIDLVVLAGYMRILSPYFVKKYKNKILNIHPSLLPRFKGVNAIARAFNHGSKLTGVTVHFVDSKVDHGPVILQSSILIKKSMKLKSLEKEIHKLEHKLYPLAIKLFAEKKLKVRGRKVAIN